MFWVYGWQILKTTFFFSEDTSVHAEFDHFWATVCKTVRPMLSDRCLSVLSCLSVTLVYCGETVHHRITLSSYIFAPKAYIDNRKKLVKQQ